MGATSRGRLVEKWFPNGINAQYAWNPDNTLARVRNRLNHSDSYVLSQHDYSYNGVGQRSQALDKLGVHTPPPMDEAYAYDPLGNRQGKNDGTTPLHYLHDAANQLLEARAGSPTGPLVQAYVHDANGNLTRKCAGGAVTRSATHCTGASVTTLAYDALDRLVQADQDGQVSHYAYDHAGRRIRKTVAGATVDYLYNGPDILAEYRNWGKADASYVHGPATDDPLLRVTAANDVSYHHADGLGSIVATSDATSNLTAAQLYDAWGQPHPSARLGSLGQYGYTGREPDETGLMYYRARYYDPAIGRFTQRDPLGMPDGVNRYAYVANSPTNFTDPTGEFIPLSGAGAILGGISGAISGGISGYMTAGANATFYEKAKNAGIGGLVGLGVGAATGAALQPQLASVLSVQAVSGVIGTVVSNPATTAITQRINNQPVRPMENFTMANLAPGFVASVAGPAAVAIARVGATLVNATSAGVQSVTGASAPMIALESNVFGRATELLSGTVNGLVAGTLGANQTPSAPYATTGTGGGTQSLQSFSELATPLSGWTFGADAPSSYYGAAPARTK